MRIGRDAVILLLSFFILTFVFLYTKQSSSLSDKGLVSFEESMTKYDPGHTSKILTKKLNEDLRWKKVKDLYVKNILTREPSILYRIPKTIHQIWLGSPIPEKYKEIQASWQKYHPDWQYYLWTEKEADALIMQNRALYDSTEHLGEKSEILRYEILYQMGGLYVDTDFECLRPFDILHKLCDFYVGLENIEKNLHTPRCANGLIGCIPSHPILKECLERLGSEHRMGSMLLSRVFFNLYHDTNFRNVALPASYFYPLPTRKNESFVIHH